MVKHWTSGRFSVQKCFDSPFKHDYERALLRIDHLMDAKPGTKAGDELDVLTTIVEAYEAKHHAVSPPDPSKRFVFGWINWV